MEHSNAAWGPRKCLSVTEIPTFYATHIYIIAATMFRHRFAPGADKSNPKRHVVFL
jgi:hypothetical protein